jgi:putative transposase
MREDPGRAPQARDLGRSDHHPADPSPSRPRTGASPHWSHMERVPPSAGQGVLACDFFVVETVFPKTLYVLFFIEVATRRVHVAGTTGRPNSAWVTQRGRNLAIKERLDDMHLLIRDRNGKFSGAFDAVVQTEGLTW